MCGENGKLPTKAWGNGNGLGRMTSIEDCGMQYLASRPSLRASNQAKDSCGAHEMTRLRERKFLLPQCNFHRGPTGGRPGSKIAGPCWGFATWDEIRHMSSWPSLSKSETNNLFAFAILSPHAGSRRCPPTNWVNWVNHRTAHLSTRSQTFAETLFFTFGTTQTYVFVYLLLLV